MKVRTTKGVNLVLRHPKLGSGKIKRQVFCMFRGHTHQDNPNPSQKKKEVKPKKEKVKPKKEKEDKIPIFVLPCTKKQAEVIRKSWHAVKDKPTKKYYEKAAIQFVNATKGRGKAKKTTVAYLLGIIRNMENHHEDLPKWPAPIKPLNTPAQSHRNKTQPIKFPNEDVKIVFLYWQRMGYPFVKHKEIMSIVTARGIEKTRLAIKKHGKDEVMKAMQRTHDMFNAGWFKHRAYFNDTKLNLPQFFRYDNGSYERVRRKIKDCPLSWFKEALKGQHYLESKYHMELRDRKPRITSRLMESWEKYNGNNGNGVSNGTKNQIIRSSRILSKFSTANDLDPITLTDIIDGALNKWHTIKPKHAGYLTNKIFWNEQLPDELVRYGAIEAGRRIERIL